MRTYFLFHLSSTQTAPRPVCAGGALPLELPYGVRTFLLTATVCNHPHQSPYPPPRIVVKPSGLTSVGRGGSLGVCLLIMRPLRRGSKKLKINYLTCGGVFDLEGKQKELHNIEQQIQDPQVWQQHEKLKILNQQKTNLQKIISDCSQLQAELDDHSTLLDLCQQSQDTGAFQDLVAECAPTFKKLEQLETQSLLGEAQDALSCYVSINSGAGGTEACDWAAMLMRMYQRYAQAQSYKTEVISMHEGDGAGIKSCTLSLEGAYSYGYLKVEKGVHRLVRISPFDSSARRHTSFASVFVWPQVDDSIEVNIQNDDLRIDTYRASGAGGQHVNKTDSAVRITHLPTQTVVQCQSERSQHSNKDKAMKLLRAALYERELKEKQKQKAAAEKQKMINEWGSQIRSYILHPYKMVKDHRTQLELSQPQAVLDGDLTLLIEKALKYYNTG